MFIVKVYLLCSRSISVASYDKTSDTDDLFKFNPNGKVVVGVVQVVLVLVDFS